MAPPVRGRHHPIACLTQPYTGREKALVAVIQEAWIGGVSTRRVDELVQAMGLSGISKSDPVALRDILHRRASLEALTDDPSLHSLRPLPPARRALPDLDPPREPRAPSIVLAIAAAFAHANPSKSEAETSASQRRS